MKRILNFGHLKIFLDYIGFWIATTRDIRIDQHTADSWSNYSNLPFISTDKKFIIILILYIC